MIDMNIKVEGLAELELQMNATAKEMVAAVSMGINRTALKVKTEVKAAISSEFMIKQKDVAPRIKIIKARYDELRAEINPFGNMKRGRSLHLSDFIVGNKERYLRRKGVSPRKQKTIKVRVKRGGAAKTVRNAFLIRSKTSGKLIMMQRKGDAQYPIKAIRTVDVPSMFGSRKVLSRIVRRAHKDLPIEVGRALKHVISKRG